MFRWPELRPPEWLVLAYFTYVSVLASWEAAAWETAASEAAASEAAASLGGSLTRGIPRVAGITAKTWLLTLAVAASLLILTRVPGKRGRLLRDFAPLAFTLFAYREMDWFTPALRDHRLERLWIVWDRWALDQCHLRAVIESAGALMPSGLELCYLLVYGIAPVSLALLFLSGRRDHVSRFWLAYLAGTLGAYALFPYFPSEPPRIVFSGADLPHVATVFRRVNLWILGGYAIHSSVFPSAHVSSAFSAAWALFVTIPKRLWIGSGMALYAVLVAIATIYGRYHYAADALAGFGVSFLAVLSLMLSRPKLSGKIAESTCKTAESKH